MGMVETITMDLVRGDRFGLFFNKTYSGEIYEVDSIQWLGGVKCVTGKLIEGSKFSSKAVGELTNYNPVLIYPSNNLKICTT